jgi:hypothetical protein
MMQDHNALQICNNEILENDKLLVNRLLWRLTILLLIRGSLVRVQAQERQKIKHLHHVRCKCFLFYMGFCKTIVKHLIRTI